MATAFNTPVLTPEIQKEAAEAAAFELCRRSFVRYLDFVNILEPPDPTLGVQGGKTKLQKWPHIVEMAEAFEKYRFISVLKARQLGFSWTATAYATWLMRFHPPASTLAFSKSQREAIELVSKARFILNNLPERWRVPYAASSRQELSLKGLESSFVALPSTEDAGRSFTASLLLLDEADYQKYFDTTYVAARPTIDSSGGSLIMGSSSNKRKMASLFKETYRAARDVPRKDRNDFKRLFFGWDVRPGRDKKWYRNTRNTIPETDLAELGLTPDSYMEQEYPKDADEALKPPKTLAHFDQEVLERMERDDSRTGEKLGPITYFQKYRFGSKYVAGTDTGHGVGGDYSVTVVIDVMNGFVVADCMSNEMHPDEYIEHVVTMLREYRRPLWAIEDNENGIESIRLAQRVSYPRLYKRRTSRNNAEVGWHTDGSNRTYMWGELAEVVRNRRIIVPNRNGIQQFYSVIQDPATRRPAAMKGAHDDYPLACAIAWQIRDASYGSAMSDKIISLPKAW